MSLDEYQIRFVRNVQAVIGRNWLRRKPYVRILDMGCDVSGRQLNALAQLTRGEVVGINIPDTFPTEEARRCAGSRVTMLRMDGTNLQFEDESFDLVISANVMEHVSDPAKYIRECARVLRSSGIAYLETAPVWTSARGHHVMESMIGENCPTETRFRDDGSIVPDWAHLRMSRDELESVLVDKVDPSTCRYILWYLFESGDLNRAPWSKVQGLLQHAFPVVKISTWPIAGVRSEQMPTDNMENYQVYGFAAEGRKTAANGLTRRICWRLRRIGL